VIRQPAVKGKPIGQLAFDVLKLFAPDPERIEVACDLIRRSHALENHAGRLGCVPGTMFLDNGSGLGMTRYGQQSRKQRNCNCEIPH
jgi:hypothetical protein